MRDRSLAKVIALVISALLGPVVLVSLYLVTSRVLPSIPYWLDIPVIVAAVALGSLCVVVLRRPWSRVLRTIVLVLYVLTAFPLLTVYSLGFVCARYDNCL